MSKFSSRDICAIIKACGEAGVRRLVCGELTIDFGAAEVGQPTQTLQSPTGPWVPNQYIPTSLHPAEMGSQEDESQAFFAQDEETLEHLRSANLLLDDPVAYEDERILELNERERLQAVDARYDET